MSLDSVDPDWYPTSTDPEWSDLEPINLTELDHKFVTILGSAQYQAIMGYLRALIATKEYSTRGLKLTTVAIQLLASNYTVWHYRRECIDALGGDWAQELEQMIAVADDNPKTYQVWQFRKVCTAKLNAPQNELVATQDYIFGDQKNYHVWGYRQWLLRTFPYELTKIMITKQMEEGNKDKEEPGEEEEEEEQGEDYFFTQVDSILLTYLAECKVDYLKLSRLSKLTLEQIRTIPLFLLPLWPYEFQFCDALLFNDTHCDVRNNSAWNQRMFVLGFAYSLLAPHPNQLTTIITPESLQGLITTSFNTRWSHEVKLVIDSLSTVMNNESAYNYLHGLCALEYKYPIASLNSPRLPVANSSSNFTIKTTKTTTTPTTIIAPDLTAVYHAILSLHHLSLSKYIQKYPQQDNDPKVQFVTIQNRFLLSFLVDFFIILLKVQPTSLFQSSTITQPSSSSSPSLLNLTTKSTGPSTLASFTTGGENFTTIDNVKTLTANLFQSDVEKSSLLFTSSTFKQLLDTTIEVTNALVTSDPLRAKYWTFRNIQLNQRFTTQLEKA